MRFKAKTLAQSPSYNFLYMEIEDSYKGQPQPFIVAGARQQAGALCPIYESSYIKICNSDTRLQHCGQPPACMAYTHEYNISGLSSPFYFLHYTTASNMHTY